MNHPVSPESKKLGISFAYLVFFLASLSAFGSFVNDMYLPSLPAMKVFFNCSVSTVQLGLTFGMIGLGVGQILLGPLSDKYGRKSVLMISLLVFIAGAVVSVFSPTIHFFLWCRLVQGLGASGAYFLARTIPADVYQGRPLAKTMALIGAINGIAPASAPVIGGVVSDHFEWKGVFVLLTIIALLILLGSIRLKETLPPERRFKGNIAEAFRNYPVLLRNKPFMIHVLLKSSALGLLFAYVSSAPFIFQTHYGYSQTVFGLFMGGNALFIVVGSMLALKFKELKNAAYAGAWIVLGAILVQSVMLWTGVSFWLFELLLLPMLYGLGMLFTVSNTLAMNEGREDAGSASAILGVGGYIFGAIVSPLVGKGDIMHSTAIVFLAVSVIILVAAILSHRLPADLQANADLGHPAGSTPENKNIKQ